MGSTGLVLQLAIWWNVNNEHTKKKYRKIMYKFKMKCPAQYLSGYEFIHKKENNVLKNSIKIEWHFSEQSDNLVET